MYLGNFKVQERYLLPRGLVIIKNLKNIYGFQSEKVGAVTELHHYIHFIMLFL